MGQSQATQQLVTKLQEGAQSAQAWNPQGSFLDIQRYSFPQSDISLRMQENVGLYAINYIQVILAVLAVKCFTDLFLLMLLIMSSVGWYILLQRQHLLDLVPGGPTFNNDKKMVLMFVLNLFLLYIFENSIFTFLGIGCAIVLVHALLAISPSTAPPANSGQNEFNQVLMKEQHLTNVEEIHINMPEIQEYNLVQKK